PHDGTTLTATGATQLQVSRPAGTASAFGATIHPSGMRAWDGQFEPVRLSGDARMEFSFTGALPGGGQEELGKIAAASVAGSGGGAGKAVLADFSFIASSSSTYTIRGFDQGTQVFTRTGITPRLAMTFDMRTKTPQIWWIVVLYVLDHASAHVEYSQQNGWSGGVDWNASSTFDVDGDGTTDFTGDKIMVSPDQQTARSRVLSQVDIHGQGQGFEAFKIKTRFMDGGCFDLWWDLFRTCPFGRGRLSGSTNNPLYVSNIGSSGQDGVSLTPRQPTARWDGYFAPVPMGSDGQMLITAYGATPDGPQRLGHIIAASRPDLGPGRKALYADWSPIGSSRLGLRGYDGETLVLSRTLTPGTPAGAQANAQFPIIPILIAIYVLDHASAHVDYSSSSGWSGGVDWNNNITADTDGDGVDDFRGDKLMVVALDGSTPATTIDTITIGMRNVRQLTMRGHHLPHCLEVSGRARCALGQAEITSQPGGGPHIRVSSIGSSGQDGVSFAVASPADARGRLTWGDPHVDEKDGTRLSLALSGVPASGGEERILGSSSVSHSGGQLSLSADWSGAGSSSVRATAYRNGAVVWSGALPNGALAKVSSPPTGGDLQCDACLGFSWGANNPGTFTVSGSPPFEADLWAVSAGQSSLAPTGGINSIRLLATDLDDLLIDEALGARFQVFAPLIKR
ncbi:MAG TPA: hypothetical protein VGE07_14170, partial [Herpetosiphonaceae bacterium]